MRKFLYIDLDVHQGNGVARDVLHFQDGDFHVADVYCGSIFPMDAEAKRAVRARAELRPGTGDEEYLEAVRAVLGQAFAEFREPDLVLYNAGTDVLDGDPLGRLRVSADAIVRRDGTVFAAARDHACPIVMATSGGYAPRNWRVIADSLANLHDKFGILTPAAL